MTAVMERTPLSHLGSIDLVELTARAHLLTRLDRKYVLPSAELPELLAGLPAGTRVLEVDGRREFSYRSVYFDTPDLDSYLAAARSRRRRFKTRVRTYVDTRAEFLEVKTRGPRGVTVKHRIPYEGTTLDGDARAYLDEELAEAGIACDTGRLRPMLVSTYLRSTLYLPGTGSRVTIDTDLRWRLPDGTTTALGDRAIVETKCARGASEVDRLLWSVGHRPCAISKYATGLAALRPDLPAHRWLPVLRRHFAPTFMEMS